MSQGSPHSQPLATLLGPPLWVGWAETSTKGGCESGPAAPSLCESPVGLGAWSPQDQHLLELFANRKMARLLGPPLTWREKCEVGIPWALVGSRLPMGRGPSQAAKTGSCQEGGAGLVGSGHCLGDMGAGPASCCLPTSKREKLRHRDWK